ncbi:Hypothetical_protein [Hexamita inflata]|uniref:Hypothetical_protein n=1 Tax=Hexamita inflata TaxID=28002 RepID=A0AA86P7L1_9EUKA|nr:Hypothetical protein HINF_LOCUS20818 [Hexamita inflata]
MMFVYESKMYYHGNIKLQERFILRKRINLEHFSGCLQHGKLLSTMFGATIYCVRVDPFIKAQDKKTNSIWESPVRKQSSLKVVIQNKVSLTVTTQATMNHSILQIA